MQEPLIITEMHNAFRRVDASASPQGLYALGEYASPENPHNENWAVLHFVLSPALKALGYESSKWSNQIREGRFDFKLPGVPDVAIWFTRLSKIKVRRYGNAYQLDRHVNFSKRWRELHLDAQIRSAARERTSADRAFFFLGFAKERIPFREEFVELHESLGCLGASAHFSTQHWEDPQDRGFQTVCASWYWPATASQQ